MHEQMRPYCGVIFTFFTRLKQRNGESNSSKYDSLWKALFSGVIVSRVYIL